MKIAKPNTELGWAMSTSHMTENDNRILCKLVRLEPDETIDGCRAAGPDHKLPFDLVAYFGGYNLCLWTRDDLEVYADLVHVHELSPAFYHIVLSAIQAVCRYLRFDVDQDANDAFQTFEW